MATPLVAIWFRKNGGIWNGSSLANPAGGLRGIDLSPISGQTLYATEQGTGDVLQTFNFGASAFSYPVPSGFTPGWPDNGSGWTTFDPAKAQGAVTLSNGNLTVNNVSTSGNVQVVHGKSSGHYYFEYTCGSQDVFNNLGGGGVGRLLPGVSDWFTGSFNGSGDFNGGGVCVGGFNNTWVATLYALNVARVNAPFTYVTGDVISVAVSIGSVVPTQTFAAADLWFGHTNGFVDLTSAANRRNFISVGGGAVNLGADGSAPFVVAPPVLLTRNGAASTFALNNGRGGAFSVSGGSLTAGSSNPPATPTSLTTVKPYSPGQGILGDYLTGNLYAFNPATYTDNGTQRRWLRRWRALPQGQFAAVRFSWLAVDMETGAMADGVRPQVILRWSDDGGHTWSDGHIAPVGGRGDTAFTVKYNRLGMTRRFSGSDRIFELSSTDPFKIAINDAEVETE